MGLLRFQTNYFARLEKRLATPWSLSLSGFAENLLREIPLPNSVHAEEASDFLARLAPVTAILLSNTRMMGRKEETGRGTRKGFQVVRFIALRLTLFSYAQQAVHLRGGHDTIQRQNKRERQY